MARTRLVVIAPRFGDIFRNNSTKNGLVPVVLSDEVVERLHVALDEDPEMYQRADRWIEAADWIIWQLCGAETRAFDWQPIAFYYRCRR